MIISAELGLAEGGGAGCGRGGGQITLPLRTAFWVCLCADGCGMHD